jgi:hypothetical protein
MIAALPVYEDAPLTIPEMLDGLVSLSADDIVLMMAQAAIWVDPIGVIEGDEYGREHSSLIGAIENVRDLWPDCYPLVVEMFHNDDWERMDDVVTQIHRDELPAEMKHYYEFENIDSEMDDCVYIPLQPVGFFGPEEYDEEEEAEGWCGTDEMWLEIIDAIGNDMDEDRTRDVARAIADDLREREDDVLENVGTFVMWLYGVSNNTMFDNSHDAYWEAGWDSPRWYDYEFIFIMQQEAFDLFDQAMAGKRALERDPALLDAILKNSRKMAKRRNINAGTKLEWPQYAGDCDAVRSRTQLDFKLLPFRSLSSKG